MTDSLIATAVVLLLATVVLLVVLLRRRTAVDISPVLERLETVQRFQERLEDSLEDEIARSRLEAAEQARGLREEVQGSLRSSTESLVQSLAGISTLQQGRLTDFANQLTALRQEGNLSAAELRRELAHELNTFKCSQEKLLSENITQLHQHFESVGGRLSEFSQASQNSAKETRTELAGALRDFKDSLQRQMHEMVGLQKQQFDSFAGQLTGLTEKSEKKSDELRVAVEKKLEGIQADNARQLEQMRTTVDEKLQGTLEKRLGESFKLVSERLEQVHKGLGEMQVLATGVGDLKKVLTNVKTRGTWGEVQLGAMLEQVMTPEQYTANVDTKGSGERVEFAIKFPGRSGDKEEIVWLPIDAKFPTEDYLRLVEAQEKADPEAAEAAIKQLEARVKGCAWSISEKYLNPPKTTDFGILFLPTEGLFAEVVRRIGLTEYVQRECHVIIAGPTTLFSILNSLQMGFRTLAIQQRSSEVWNLLAAVKAEFGKYGDVLDRVQRKLSEASNTIDQAAVRTRSIERKLRDVQELPATDGKAGLIIAADGDGDENQGGKTE